MAFTDVPTKVDFPAMERDLLRFWKETDAFAKLVERRRNAPKWSFIDGPITANNPMGVHHGWGRTYKDLMHRFWSMRGRRTRFQNGFDCQGLWVEVEVEKEMGFKSKKDIEAYGLEKFVRKCKARVLRYAAVQTEQSVRLGFWMDWNDPDTLRMLSEKIENSPDEVITVYGPNGPVTDTVEMIVGRLGLAELGGSYFTFSNENNYLIWAMIKKCYERGWLYRGADVMPWCPRCATGISQHEIVTDGYAELTHRSVTLRFRLRGRENESLLVWTTTPWTLTSNVAAAVGPDLTYVQVRQGEEIFYLSKGALKMLKGEYQVLGELQGSEMVGWTYDGPFEELPAANLPGGLTELTELIEKITATAVQVHQVIAWSEVGEAEGTGIVHIAPGCGAEDYHLGQEHGFPMIAPLDEEGQFVDGLGWLSGMHVTDVADPIFESLKEKGLLYRIQDYTHRYPTCWRCKTELVFRLVDEWFISMGESYDKPREQLTSEEKNRSLRYQIMDVVDQIRWVPEFGYSREMDWLRNMHDWMISKKRYWGLALPIWICESCGKHEVMGSEHELKERAVEGWEAFEGHTPHRPYIDAVKLECQGCGGRMNRIADVGNPWLDAGIVSFSTLGYRTDRKYWEEWFPADWISESFPGQFRNWFYSLLAMATVMERRPPFLHNFGYATLLAEDGSEMHKSAGNMIEFNEAADKMGVDVMRWLFCNHRPENDLPFGYHRGNDARRAFLIPLWNVYSFFVTYANLDGWTPAWQAFDPDFPEGPTPVSDNLLDRWILARLNELPSNVVSGLENSDPQGAIAPLGVFLDDLSNWYVRRSRRRFWKSEADADKQSAYATLYHVLVKFARLLAPFTPFVSEAIYQNLVCQVQPCALGSVHHTLLPEQDAAAMDRSLLDQMALARQVASLGLAARNAAGLKVRQPLSRALAYAGGRQTLDQAFIDIITDELNVKRFDFVAQVGELVRYQIMPDNKLLGPRFGAAFPKVRQALNAMDPAKVAAAVTAGQPVVLEVDGETVELQATEVLVQTHPAEGLAVAADKLATVAVDATVTTELRREGLAREAVRRIQALRKDAGFEIADRIVTYYVAQDEFAAAFEIWAETIKGETLSVELVAGPPPDGAYRETQSVEGETLTLGVMRK